MVTGSHKDFRVSQHYQAEMRRQAEQHRLGEEVQDEDETTSGGHKWIARAALAMLVGLVLFVGYGQAHAQDAWDIGESELLPEAMRPYRFGSFYLVTGDDEQAVARLSEAIALMPAGAFAALSRYSVIYWTLAQAQEQAGMRFEVLISYRQFLTLAGKKAAPWTFEKAVELEAQPRWASACTTAGATVLATSGYGF